MIVIGADTHKRTHALAAVDDGTGRTRGAREITADDGGHLDALRWASSLDEERVWAIEDCRSVSRRLERALLAAGERVVRVPPQRMGASRRGEREPGKSDEIDALAVARAVVKDGPECFPPPISMSGRWRAGCSQITARISSPSAPGCRTGCAGICWSSAPSSSAH